MILQDDIVRTLKSLLTQMGFTYDDIELREDQLLGGLVINVRTPDSRRLIGKNGETLRSINLVVHALLEKNTASQSLSNTPPANFTIDIDGYLAQHIEQIKAEARIIADRVRSFKTSICMNPMSSYDRRIVHNFLAHSPNVATQSQGMGHDRCVEVSYVEDTSETI